ncbi:MAG: hypothetical protein R3335_08130 [Anaerolineales bacterium]|nr:hypothetical protein [Anaerolineales bacterium]
MYNYICITCGNQFGSTPEPPPQCPICEDERQYINPNGQAWTTHAGLLADHQTAHSELEPGLHQFWTEPKFGIGQRTLLVQAPHGNVLWDCISMIDPPTIAFIEGLGGISALSSSHPHMFASMVEWSHAFGKAPIYLHRDFERWVQRPDPVIQYWDGESLALEAGVALHRCGGHFTGQTILHWPDGAEGRGAVFTSDALFVNPGRREVAFMYSYPNYIPLSAGKVDRIVDAVMPLAFDRIYSHFYQREILADGKEAIRRSAERHKRFIRD